MRLFFISIFILVFVPLTAQEYVTWPNTGNTSVSMPISGFTISTVPLINVTLDNVGTNNAVSFESPSGFTNLPVTGSLTFETHGPVRDFPANNVSFTFDHPVIVTTLNVDDIDSGSWDDSFDFLGIAFSSSNASNCTAFATGVNVGLTTGSASWSCSGPVTTFSIDYTGNTVDSTTAALGYSIQIFPIPEIAPICQGGSSPSFPQIGDGIQGVWNAEEIDTAISGTFEYVFTPNSGQALTCPVTVQVTIYECCPATLILTSPDNNVSNSNFLSERQAETWIRASNHVTSGNDSIDDGVIYHAGSFVELIPGFEAFHGAQFAAYIEGCTDTYEYRLSNQQVPKPVANVFQRVKPQNFKIAYDTRQNNLTAILIDATFDACTIVALDGRTLMHKQGLNDDTIRFDIAALPNGVYILNARDKTGSSYNEKFIKN